MKIATENLEDHQVKLTVEIEPERLEREKRRAAKKIARKTKIPGFRPGKAPYHIVERTVGTAVILEEALDSLVEDLYPKVLDESGVKPYGPGSLEDYSEDDQPVFKFLVPLAPEVTLGDYHSIRVPYQYEEVTDDDVARFLDQIRERQAVVQSVERPAEEGDLVYLTLHASKSEPAEGDDATLIPLQHLNILIEKERTDPEVEQNEAGGAEWPFPGFSREIIGLSSGQDKTLRYTFPEDHEDETLRAVSAVYSVAIDEVKSRTLPELDDALAQSVGEYETLEDLKTYLHEVLSQQKMEEYAEAYDDLILSELNDISEVEYPPQMLEREIEAVKRGLVDRLARQNLDLETYLKTREIDEEQLREEMVPVARRRVQRGLLLMEVSEVEKIEVDPQEVESEASRTIDQLYQMMPRREARRRLTGDVVQDLVGQILGERTIQLTLERLRRIAKGELGEEFAEDHESPETESGETPSEPAVNDRLGQADAAQNAEQEAGEKSEPEDQPDVEDDEDVHN